MVDYISQIRTSLTTKFSEDWWSDLTEKPIKRKPVVFEKLAGMFADLRADIFVNLNASLLTGEYCSVNDFCQYLGVLESEIDNIVPVMPEDEDAQAFLQEHLNENFIQPVKAAIRGYRSFAFFQELKFQFDTRHFVHFSGPELEGSSPTYILPDEVKFELRFFGTNLRLAIVDFSLKPDKEDFQELRQISDDILKNLSNNLLSILLKQKCDFLLAKWILRKEHITKQPIYSIEGSRDIEVTVEKYKGSESFQTWYKYIDTHYEFSTKWKAEIQKESLTLKNNTLTTLPLFKLHTLIKYYKDVDNNLTQLSKIRKEISRRFDECRDSENYDYKYTYAIAFNYAINNEFSLLIDLRLGDDERIRTLYEEVLLVQSDTNVKNFFPQYKYLQFLVGKLEEVYNQRQALGFIKAARKIVDECEKIFSAYEENVEWSKENYNYAFKLPHSESLVEVRNSRIPNMFIFSTFLLPLPKEEYIKKFEENRQKVYNLKTSIEVFENIEPEILEFDKKKREVMDRDIKSMEVIAIFTAIVTFVVGSLPTFKFISTAYQAGLFMFALSSSLALFVLLIISTTRGASKLKDNLLTFVFLLVIAIASWYILVFKTVDPALKSPSQTKPTTGFPMKPDPTISNGD